MNDPSAFLTSEIGESPELPRVLVGMATVYYNNGDLATAAEVAHGALAAAVFHFYQKRIALRRA